MSFCVYIFELIMNLTYDSSGVEMSNACFQQATFDFSEVEQYEWIDFPSLKFFKLNGHFFDSSGITYCLPKATNCVIDSRGVACLVKECSCSSWITDLVTCKVYDRHLKLTFTKF